MENQIHCQVSFKNGYVLIELEGLLSDGFLLAVSKQVQESQEYKPGMPEVWEISSADLSEIYPESIAKVSEGLEDMWDGFIMSKVAVVSRKSLNMGHIYLFREFYDRDFVQVFESLEEAEKWLAE